jgi:hypothetical protein
MRVPTGPSNVPQFLRSGVKAIEITTKPAIACRRDAEGMQQGRHNGQLNQHAQLKHQLVGGWVDGYLSFTCALCGAVEHHGPKQRGLQLHDAGLKL